MLIDATHPEETRVVVVDGNRVEEFDYESITKVQIAGNIYLAKVTRVEPSLQAAFIDYGGNRHGFLAFAEIHPDYYQIPVADREALIAAERAADEAERAAEEEAETERKGRRKSRRSRRRRGKKDVEAPITPIKFELVSTDADDVSAIPEKLTSVVASAENGFWFETPPSSQVALPAQDAEPDLSDVSEITIKRQATDEELAATGEETVTETVVLSPEQAEEDGDAKPKAQAEAAGAQRADTVTGDVAEGDAQADDIEDSDADDDDGDNRDEDNRDEDVEEVGADDAREEIRPRRIRMRDYKIQEVIKKRQIMLVQVVKEERGSKGAALTTYLSLAGRYCVLMPNTARGGGISRKITNAADRKRLKAVAEELEVPDGMGLIIRTAGANRTKAEIKRDYEYLLRQWTAVRDLTLKSVAPTLIYEEGSLIKRSIRDLYGKEIDTVLVEGAEGFQEAKDYMRMLAPSHAKHVQAYAEPTPLFIRHQVETQMADMLNPTVQLKSGGYIVIGVTEALVAIDVNSGRSTKEASIEETALKTNLEAAEEVSRQLKLRDLAGLIVIDFIDMEEPRNNRAVEKRLKDKLKNDRARLQIGRISGFGLLEMSRQRLRPGLLEATTTTCPHCQGAGVIRSDESLALAVLRSAEEEGVRGRSQAVRVAAPVPVANYLINYKRARIAQIEERYSMQLIIDGDPSLVSPNFSLERTTPLTRAEVVNVKAVQIESGFSEHSADDAELVEEFDDAEDVQEEAETEEAKTPRSRRRSRRGKKADAGNEQASTETDASDSDDAADENADADLDLDQNEASADDKDGKRRRGRRGGRRRRKKTEDASDPLPVIDLEAEAEAEADSAATDGAALEAEENADAPETAAAAPTIPEPAAAMQTLEESVATVQPADLEPAHEAALDVASPPPKEERREPRRSGWWNLRGRG
ncbi:MAG: Rne/Rng family ribonuclease [Pseudomonadota bacterium]